MRYDRIIFVLLAAMLFVTLLYRNRPSSVAPAPAVSSVSEPASGYVRISGVVKHPGMYPLSAKTMAIDVIKMAEPAPGVTESGLAKFAAMPVTSGDAIEVRIQADGTPSLTKGIISVAERLVMGIPLDINSMSEADFDRVPGIGPAMAKRIVLYRQKNGGIMSAQDLIYIEGIGEKKISALRRYFK